MTQKQFDEIITLIKSLQHQDKMTLSLIRDLLEKITEIEDKLDDLGVKQTDIANTTVTAQDLCRVLDKI